MMALVENVNVWRGGLWQALCWMAMGDCGQQQYIYANGWERQWLRAEMVDGGQATAWRRWLVMVGDAGGCSRYMARVENLALTESEAGWDWHWLRMVDGGTGTGTGKQLHDGSSGLGATAVTFPLVSPWSLHTPLLSFKHIFTLQYANLPQRVVVIKNLFSTFQSCNIWVYSMHQICFWGFIRILCRQLFCFSLLVVDKELAGFLMVLKNSSLTLNFSIEA